MKYQQIYEDVLAYCVASPPPLPWSRLADGEKVLRTPLNDEAMLKALCEKHPRSKLVRAGIAVKAGLHIHLNPVLLNLPGTILPLRMTPDGPPFDFVTEQGTARECLPMRSVVLDHRTSKGIAECGYLFLTFGIQDLIRLRMLGMPVAPALGLERFSDQSLQDFRFALGLCEKKPPNSPHQLILVDWGPARLSGRRNELADQVVHSLIDNRFCLGISLHNILIWQPTLTEVRAISDCLQIGRLQDVVAAIQASLEQSCSPLVADPAGPNHQPDLLECERRLMEAMVSPNSCKSRRRRRMRDFDRALEQEIVQPLLQHAENQQDLAEQNRWRGVAELSRSLYRATAVQRVKLEKEIIEQGLPSEACSQELSKLLRGFDTVHKMLKEDD